MGSYMQCPHAYTIILFIPYSKMGGPEILLILKSEIQYTIFPKNGLKRPIKWCYLGLNSKLFLPQDQISLENKKKGGVAN